MSAVSSIPGRIVTMRRPLWMTAIFMALVLTVYISRYEGGPLEMEPAFPAMIASALAARGHTIARVHRIAGGMNAISLHPDGTMTGAACWRADGTPVGISGGLARAGVRFAT